MSWGWGTVTDIDDDVDFQGGSGEGRARRSADASSGKPSQVSSPIIEFWSLIQKYSWKNECQKPSKTFIRFLDGKNVKFSTVSVALLALQAAQRFKITIFIILSVVWQLLFHSRHLDLPQLPPAWFWAARGKLSLGKSPSKLSPEGIFLLYVSI